MPMSKLLSLTESMWPGFSYLL